MYLSDCYAHLGCTASHQSCYLPGFADFISLLISQVKLGWSQLKKVQNMPSGGLVQIMYDKWLCPRSREGDGRVLSSCVSWMQCSNTHMGLGVLLLSRNSREQTWVSLLYSFAFDSTNKILIVLKLLPELVILICFLCSIYFTRVLHIFRVNTTFHWSV